MCVRIECRRCGRPSYAGCGRHVEQVLGDVPAAQRCQCRDGSWWSRVRALFGM